MYVLLNPGLRKLYMDVTNFFYFHIVYLKVRAELFKRQSFYFFYRKKHYHILSQSIKYGLVNFSKKNIYATFFKVISICFFYSLSCFKLILQKSSKSNL